MPPCVPADERPVIWYWHSAGSFPAAPFSPGHFTGEHVFKCHPNTHTYTRTQTRANAVFVIHTRELWRLKCFEPFRKRMKKLLVWVPFKKEQKEQKVSIFLWKHNLFLKTQRSRPPSSHVKYQRFSRPSSAERSVVRENTVIFDVAFWCEFFLRQRKQHLKT